MKRRFFSRDEASASSDLTPPSLRPAPPIAKRLNRNALTVAAVVMGMTVLTAVVVVNPSKEARQPTSASNAADEAPQIPPRPAFLDQPVRSMVPAAVPAQGEEPAPRTILGATTPPIVQTSSLPMSPSASYPAAYGTGMDQPSVPGPAPVPPDAAPSPRDRSYHAALASSVVIGQEENRTTANPAGQPPLAVQEQQLLSFGDSMLRANLHPASAPGVGATPEAVGAVGTRDLRSFSDRAVSAARANTVVQLEGASTAYALRAGTVIPGLLITSVNSELPGEIVGQVSRNVYDSRTQRLLLIPKGSRLIGSYENQVAAGQGRLLVAWTRLILPDGRSMRLPGLALTDPQGNAGAKGRVDNHWRRVFGNALLLSAIGAGVQLSQPATGSVLSTPSAGQVAAGAVGQELSNVALEVLRRGMDVSPTITIPAGQPFNVLLSGDLLFEESYTPHG